MTLNRRVFLQSLGVGLFAARFSVASRAAGPLATAGLMPAASPASLWKTVETMGRARWIWTDNAAAPNAWISFRRTFTLAAKPGEALIQVACADKYWLWINGLLVRREGALKSGPTRTDWYVDEWDIAQHLHAGENQIAVLAWFFGRPGSSHRNSGKAGLLLRLVAQDMELVTDSRWLARRHPAFGQRGGGVSVTLCEQAVDFDARQDMPGWTGPGFDDSAWKPAAEQSGAGTAPWGKLVSRPTPFWADREPRECALDGTLPITGPAVVVGRFPVNIQVYPIIRVNAPAGREITLQIERDKKTTRYTTRDGEQEFEVPAWGNGHFVTCTIPAGVTVAGLSYRETGYATDFAGAFISSEPALDLLWTKAARTTHLCMRDTFMDCPDRERSCWPGDAANAFEVAFRSLDRRADALVEKTLREFAGWASPGGNLWGAVPTSRFENSFREFPAQTLGMLGFGVRTWWLNTGNRELLAAFYPAMRRYLLELFKVDQGMVVHRGPRDVKWGAGVQCWYDWGENIDGTALDQTLYYAALGMLADAARVLGRADDGRRCDELRASMRNAFDSCWSVADGAYRSNGYKGRIDDRAQALAIVSGLAPVSRHARLADSLERERNASIYLERFPLEALVLAGRPQSALSRLKRRFSAEIASDYSTLPEIFGERSNHGWGGAAVVRLAEQLAGVAVTAPGAGAFAFAPRAGVLKSADYRLPTIHGPLGLAFTIQPNEAEYRLEIPIGTEVDTAFIYTGEIKINGAALPVGNPHRVLGPGSWQVAMQA